MNIAVCGICGRMGRAVLAILLERNHSLAASFDSDKRPEFGLDAGRLIQNDGLGVKISALNEADMHKAEGIIDFSSPGATLTMLDMAARLQKPVVIGTTGFDGDGRKKIEAASKTIPVLFSPNMSLGVNLMFKLTEMAARILKEGYDVEVFEAHHKFKKDAPSGTAKRLIDIIKKTVPKLSLGPEKTERTGERAADEIGIQVLRGGDIVGEHTVYFVGMGERLEITHRVQSRDTLARGAVLGMEFLKTKTPGLYSMNDVLGL